MAQLKSCQECDQKHHCQDIYQQIGKAQGPSVASKAIVAFLLPILVFIVTLAVSEKILVRIIDIKQLRIALDFLLALSVTLAIILISQQLNKNK
jgi:hypothetical protein